MVTAKTQHHLKPAEEYFEEHLAVGGCYNEKQRVAGEWIGLGARRLDLSGKVRAENFRRLYENCRATNALGNLQIDRGLLAGFVVGFEEKPGCFAVGSIEAVPFLRQGGEGVVDSVFATENRVVLFHGSFCYDRAFF